MGLEWDIVALHSCIEQYQNAITRGVIPRFSKIRACLDLLLNTYDFVMVFRFCRLQEIQRNP